MVSRRWFALLVVVGVSCSFTTGTAFKECDTDVQCGVTKACSSAGYCLPMPEGCRRFEGPFDQTGLIRLAALAPLSSARDGGNDALEQNGVNGMALAVREVNGLRIGFRFGLIVCDTFRESAATTAQVEWAVKELEVPAMVVSGNSATLLASQNAARRGAGTLIMSPNATAEGLIDLFQSDHSTFRIAPPDPMQASVLAQLMTGDAQYVAQTRVAVIYEEGNDRDQFAANVMSRLVTAGRDAGVFSYRAPVDSALLISKLRDSLRPTASVLIGSPEQVRALITETAKAPSLSRADGHKWLFSSSAKDPVLLTSSVVAREIDGMLGAAPTKGAGAIADDFRRRFIAAYGVEPISAQASFDATFLVMLSAAWGSNDAGAPTGARMAEGLLNVSDGGVVVHLEPTEWRVGVTELSNRRPITVEGVTGRLSLDPDAGAPSNTFEVWKVADGGFAIVRFAKP